LKTTKMMANRSEEGGEEEQLCQVLVDYLEASEHGLRPDAAEMVARHPEFASQLQAFLQTHNQLEELTAPVRQMSQTLFQSIRPGRPPLSNAVDAPIGRVGPAATRYVGDYEILAEIGRGGMGVVYRARDVKLGRLVAIKMIRSAVYASQADVARFLAEAQAKARLEHPDIVPIYEVGEQDGLPFLVMALVEGCSLHERLAAGPLPAVEATRLVRRVAEAIHHAHTRGVLHRDLKPQNILLQFAGETGQDLPPGGHGAARPGAARAAATAAPRVSDFGLARLVGQDGTTVTGEILGTPSYMPPEQAAGRATDVGPHSDVYSLGAVLYRILTGRPPFQAADVAETLRQVREQEPLPPRRLNSGVPRELETICLKCLEKNPSRRYPSAASLANELQRFEQGRPILASRPGPLTYAAKWLRRRPAIAGLLATILLLAVAGCVSFGWAYSAARRERMRADAEAAEARIQARDAQFGLYVSQIGRAQAELLANDQPAAARVLEQTRPELRGWEYGHLRRTSEGTPLILYSPGGQVHAIAFSPDGTRIFTGTAEGNTRVWDAHSGRELLTLRGHTGPITAVACSSDKAFVATASRDGTARVREYLSGKPILELRGHKKSVNALCFDPNSGRVATASDDQTACLWDARSGELLLTLRPEDGALNTVGFSPDGKALITGSSGNRVQVWNALSGDRLCAFATRAAVRAVALSPDGACLAAATADGGTSVWEWRSGQQLFTIRGPAAANSLAYSPDAMRLATAYADGTVQVCDAKSGTESTTLRGHLSSVDAIAFGPEGMRLATGSWDETARVWDLSTDTTGFSIRGHSGPLSTAIFSADGSRLVTGSRDKTARVWDSRTGRLLLVLPHRGTVFSAACSADGDRLATGSQDSLARIWDAHTGTELLTLAGHGASVESVEFSPDGTRLATGSDDSTARIWDLRKATQLLALKGHSGPVRAVAYSPDGTRLATASDDWTVRIWDAVTGEQLLVLAGHTAVVDAVVFSRDGSRLASASWDRTARLWDARTGAEIMVFNGHSNALTDVSFDPSGSRLATGSWDKTARVWDVATGQELVVIRGHSDKVSSAVFSPDGTLLATASHDRSARIWDSRTGIELDPARSRGSNPTKASASIGARGYEPWREADLRLSDRAPDWHADRAGASERSGNYFASAFHLGWLLRSRPLDADLHSHCADVMEMLGRTDDAAAHRCVAWLIREFAPLGVNSHSISP
jgi:WD40 repeat protein/serine/threonine protein kinase